MSFTLTEGDTVNPLIFTAVGICSPYGTALHILLSLKRGQRTVSGLITETEDLLADCDECHTNALVQFPGNTLVNELAVQWALLSPKLSELITKIGKANEHGHDTDEDIGDLAIIYDLLVTRRMTFTRNHVF